MEHAHGNSNALTKCYLQGLFNTLFVNNMRAYKLEVQVLFLCIITCKASLNNF